jgi:L,D-peptidoglycan transpeptidase YkuD (ErfK/YbiS/YcfS/YnhG family)
MVIFGSGRGGQSQKPLPWVNFFFVWLQCDDKPMTMTFFTLSQTRRFLLLGLGFIGLFSATAQAQIGNNVRQVIVARAAGWNSNTATLQAYQRGSAREAWQPVFAKPVPVLLGRAGLAWGRGVFNPPQNGVGAKVEKDWRAPAGVFQLGSLFGYASKPPAGTRWPYHQVGPWDAYVDDSNNPYYNQHVRVDPRNVPPWFEKQKMRLGDAAYKWMLEIRHNQKPAAPGYGSAIFFHVRRGPTKPSAGCTTMAVENLEALIRWLDPQASPHYVLLPQADYDYLRGTWRLP